LNEINRNKGVNVLIQPNKKSLMEN